MKKKKKKKNKPACLLLSVSSERSSPEKFQFPVSDNIKWQRSPPFVYLQEVCVHGVPHVTRQDQVLFGDVINRQLNPDHNGGALSRQRDALERRRRDATFRPALDGTEVMVLTGRVPSTAPVFPPPGRC